MTHYTLFVWVSLPFPKPKSVRHAGYLSKTQQSIAAHPPELSIIPTIPPTLLIFPSTQNYAMTRIPLLARRSPGTDQPAAVRSVPPMLARMLLLLLLPPRRRRRRRRRCRCRSRAPPRRPRGRCVGVQHDGCGDGLDSQEGNMGYMVRKEMVVVYCKEGLWF